MACALTTTDNPYNPITQFDEWYEFDTRKGYNSSAYLARLAHTSPELPTADYNKVIEDAIDEIVDLNPLGIYAKVTENKGPGGG